MKVFQKEWVITWWEKFGYVLPLIWKRMVHYKNKFVTFFEVSEIEWFSARTRFVTFSKILPNDWCITGKNFVAFLRVLEREWIITEKAALHFRCFSKRVEHYKKMVCCLFGFFLQRNGSLQKKKKGFVTYLWIFGWRLENTIQMFPLDSGAQGYNKSGLANISVMV